MLSYSINDIKGVIPALVTPFDENGKLDLQSGEKLVNSLIAKGIGGLYVTGSTGEGFLMTDDERMMFAQMVVSVVAHRVPVIVHVGDIGTDKSIALALHAQKIGADAISSVPPFYYRYSDDEIFGYYKDISDAVTIPMIVYNICLAGLMNKNLVKRLATIPNVKGFKFTGREHDDMCDIKLSLGSHFMVYSGCDEMATQGLLAGADGLIGSTYNLMSEAFVEIDRKARANDFEGAFEIQKAATLLIQQMTSFSFFPMLKCCCRFIGLCAGYSRKPFIDVTYAQFEKLVQGARTISKEHGDCGIEFLKAVCR